MDNQKNDTGLVEISAVILEQTKEVLDSISEGATLTIGEAIDRLALKMAPRNSEMAVSIALDQVVASLSALTREEFEDAYFEIAATLAAFLPREKVNSIRRAAIDKRIELVEKFRESFSEEFLEKVDETLEDGLSDEGQSLYASLMEDEDDGKENGSSADLIDVVYSLEPLIKHYTSLSPEEQDEFAYHINELFEAFRNQ